MRRNDNEKKAYAASSKKSQEIKGKYIKEKTEDLMQQGISKDKAIKIVKSKCENAQIARDDTVVLLDGSEVLAKDITFQYDGVYCLDPIEPDQAPAIININDCNLVMIYSFLHGGMKFYIQEEEFKHKSLPIVTKPVNPDLYYEKFSKKWLRYGNVVTPHLQETWKLNCMAMNNAITSTNNIKYVVPAVTGSGKTEGIITYCSLVPKHITIIISTNLIIEADRIAEAVNIEANETIAVASHSKTNISIILF